jgi:hypothetical protein
MWWLMGALSRGATWRCSKRCCHAAKVLHACVRAAHGRMAEYPENVGGFGDWLCAIGGPLSSIHPTWSGPGLGLPPRLMPGARIDNRPSDNSRVGDDDRLLRSDELPVDLRTSPRWLSSYVAGREGDDDPCLPAFSALLDDEATRCSGL